MEDVIHLDPKRSARKNEKRFLVCKLKISLNIPTTSCKGQD
jgi:hypothetical protein